MNKPRICVSITANDIEAVREIEPLADLLEVRIDLIGQGWQKLAGKLTKPWIACNRTADEGGRWQDNEARRIEKLLEAIELGADMVDIELVAKNLDKIVTLIKTRAKCLISYHNLRETPSIDDLKKIVRSQVKAGADVCKVVTTAQQFEDNLTVLNLITESPGLRLVTFAMGPLGHISRILSPLAGADFTYASIARGKESAPGQITVEELINIYGMVSK